jgi:DNA polymerase-4
MAEHRSILHVDMDAFFASIEQLDDPQLRGKPVLVGHDGPRGVVAAASYEARKYDCHSAQPMAIAKRRCPHAIIVPVRFARYREVSQRMFAILDDFSPLVEPLSVDEAFVDLTGSEKLLGDAASVAVRIRQRIAGELSLTASIGVAPNKFLAKLASDLRKPDGLVLVPHDKIDELLLPLPVGKLWGVGPVTVKKLATYGIKTVAHLRAQPMQTLNHLFGGDAEWFLRLANGIDDRAVVPDRQAKSIGQEQTFGTDIVIPNAVRTVMFEQVEQVARRLRRHGLCAAGVTIKIRYGEFETVTRSTTLAEPSDATMQIWNAARELFDRWCAAGFRPVRLIGVSAHSLTRGQPQPTMFVDPQTARQQAVDAVTDRIAKKFGSQSIRRGGGLS